MGDIILNALLYLIALILYYIEVLLCKILDLVYNMFEVFAGIEMVTIRQSDGSLVDKFLINVFFDNTAVNYVFWGMACIGIVLTFVFAVMSVGKKDPGMYSRLNINGALPESAHRNRVLFL